MKIGINASFLRKPNTGIGQMTQNFLRVLFQNKNFEFVLYLEEDLPPNLKLPENFTAKVFLPLWRRDDLVRKIWWEKYLLSKRAQKDACDVFISTYQCPTVFRKKIKHLMIVHDIIPKFFPEYLGNSRKRKYWKLTEDGIRSADKIIAVSKRTEKDLIELLGISAKKITTNYEDVDECYKKNISQVENAKVLKKYKLKPGYILAGGGYEVRKNVESVIRAYKFLQDKFQSDKELPRLAIYGKIFPASNPLATNIEKFLRELNLTKRVILLGEVPQKDMPAVFKNSVMFVYPSRYEGFGMPVLEAMNAGKPVIAAKTSSLPEVGGDAILYCDPEDVHDIAMVMRNVLINADLRQTLSIRAKERAQQFSWQKFTRKVLHIIKEIK